MFPASSVQHRIPHPLGLQVQPLDYSNHTICFLANITQNTEKGTEWFIVIYFIKRCQGGEGELDKKVNEQ